MSEQLLTFAIAAIAFTAVAVCIATLIAPMVTQLLGLIP